MLAEHETRNTPDWWLLRLGKRLSEDAPRFDRLEAYWRGNAPLPYGNQKMREAYRRLQSIARNNFGNLIAESVLERMKVIAFREGTPSDASDVSSESDEQAFRWWQANNLDADSGLVHRCAVVMSRAYVIVGPGEGEYPLITGEDPRQVIHESSPTNRREVRAALKVWWDEIDTVYRAVVYLPDTTHYFVSHGLSKDATWAQVWDPARWVTDASEFPGGVAENPLGEVPVVPFINRPDLTGEGLGEFEDVVDILDRINTVILDRLVISAMQAYRQRWAKGISSEDENGNSKIDFDPGADLLWAVEDKDAAFGEFQPTDLTPIIKSVDSDIQHLAAITRTPPQYLLAAIVNASGDALGVAESGLVSKILERTTEYGESWERVYRLSARLQGRDIPVDAEVVWKDPQFRTITELSAANVALKEADVPWRTRMRKLGMTPAEINRMQSERAEDAMIQALYNPPAENAGSQRPEPRSVREREARRDG